MLKVLRCKIFASNHLSHFSLTFKMVVMQLSRKDWLVPIPYWSLAVRLWYGTGTLSSRYENLTTCNWSAATFGPVRRKKEVEGQSQ